MSSVSSANQIDSIRRESGNSSIMELISMTKNMPAQPASLEAVGVSASFIGDLILKHLYRFGMLTGIEIANKLCLPFSMIEDILHDLLNRTYIEKRGGQGMGGATDRYGLTDRGRQHSRDLLEQDTYTGPVPVPLDQYTTYVKQQNLRSIPLNETLLREAWSDFILDESLFAQVGPAMCSGKSCFLYGPPGTGKTTIAKAIAKFYDIHGGMVAVPHAVLVGGSVIRVYDPVYHEKYIERDQHDEPAWLAPDRGDCRWVLCHRPTVIVGGELTLDMLDLRYNPTTKYYEAPLQMKANGGVFVIDDFGRQLVSPKDLLNRWIVPLEERIDYLTLHTGKKFTIPFEQMVAFATNLNPNDLADEAFLRRIRYKIYIGEPSEEAYCAIFERECKKKNLEFDSFILDSLFNRFYRNGKRPMRACDPRDLTDAVADYLVFNAQPKSITENALNRIADIYFSELK